MRYCEMKSRAKKLFFQNYGKILGMLFLELFIVGVATQLPPVGGAATFFLPFSVGIFYLMLRLVNGEEITIKEMFTRTFDKNYLRNVGGLAWLSLWTALWSLLFVIPGIVKSYSYAATPFLLAKYSSIGATEALEKSKVLMHGKKARLFGLHLSFIGWYLIIFLIMVPLTAAAVIAWMPFFTEAAGNMFSPIIFMLAPILLGLGFTVMFLYLTLFLVPYTKMADAVFMDELLREGEALGILIPEAPEDEEYVEEVIPEEDIVEEASSENVIPEE